MNNPNDDNCKVNAAAGATGADDASPGEDALEPHEDVLENTQAALLRALADNQNLLKRTEREVAKAHRFGSERLVRDLLPVLDSLERALDGGSNASVESWQEGTELTHKLLLQTLQNHGVTMLSPLGEPFDPDQHEALRVVETDQVPPNTVIEVLDTGYELNGRLVRPAKVTVSARSAGGGG